MIYLPIIGSFLEAAGMIIEKKVLKRLDFKKYTVYEFFAIVLVLAPFLYFIWNIEKEAFYLKNILIFIFVVFISIIANLLIFYSLKRESISEVEPIWIMQPIFTIILAFILFSNEREITGIILACIASFALILAHIKRNHLIYDKYILAALLGSFFFSLELIASSFILQYYNPFLFYFFRCFFIFVICYAIFKPNGKELNKKISFMILVLGAMWVVYRAIIYYGYQNLGIVFTTTLFIFSSVLMMIFAVIFLKEKPTSKQIISTIVISICVVLSIFLKNR